MAKKGTDSFTLPRAALLSALEMVAPAVATKSSMEELMHVWFDGATLTAYNDSTLGIEVPFKSPFKGGFRGNLLTGFLAASKAKEVEFTALGENEHGNMDMRITAGKDSKLELASLPIDKNIWTFPDIREDGKMPIDNELLLLLEKVMLSIGQDTSVPDQLGVSFLLDGKKIYLYATDSRTISEVSGPAPKGYDLKRVCLPSPFCEHVRKVCKKGGTLYIAENEVVATNEEGVRIFARAVDIPKPFNFFRMMDATVPKKFQPIPEDFAGAIERAGVLLEGAPGETVELSIKKGGLRLYVKSAVGELNEDLDLDQEDVTVRVDPLLLKRGLPQCSEIAIVQEAVVMAKGNYTYLVSTSLT